MEVGNLYWTWLGGKSCRDIEDQAQDVHNYLPLSYSHVPSYRNVQGAGPKTAVRMRSIFHKANFTSLVQVRETYISWYRDNDIILDNNIEKVNHKLYSYELATQQKSAWLKTQDDLE